MTSTRIAMRRRTLPLPTVLGLLLTGVAMASPVLSQTINSPYAFIDARHEATIFASMTNADRGTLRLGPGGGPLFGARYAFEITGPLALEVSSSYLNSDREVYDPRSETQAPQLLGTVTQHVMLLEGHIRLNLTGARTWYRLAPYLHAGGGLATGATQRLATEAEFGPGQQFTFGPSATLGLGAGTRWMPLDRVGVRLEGGFSIWKIGTPPAFRARTELIGPVPDAEWPRRATAALGVSYRF